MTLTGYAADSAIQGATESPVKLSAGGDLRLRNEYFNNAFALDATAVRHEQNYQRFRGRAWAAAGVGDITFTGRLAWESWNWNRDSYKAPFKKGWVTSEGIIDQVNLTWQKAFALPLTLTAGRQDIVLGDGWLVTDGTPLDGSRTNFYDAVRGTLRLSPRTTVDFIYIDQSATNHGRLSTLNNKSISLEEQDERSGIVYLAHKLSEQVQLDGYVIERDMTKALANGDAGHLTTTGSRLVYTPTRNWVWKGEAAYQFGSKNGRDLRAWGFLTQATWLARDPLANQARFTVEGLSGDRPGTARDEQFDPQWGRFPRWSEILVMTWAAETRIAQTSNLLRAGPGWSISPRKGFDVSLDYNGVWALENNRSPTIANGQFGDGRFRGQLIRMVLKYRFSPAWTGTVLGECFAPGGYYGPRHQDSASFVRVELLRTF